MLYTNQTCITHRQRQVVEHLCAVPPRIGVAVLALTLVVEAIHLCSQHAGVLTVKTRRNWQPKSNNECKAMFQSMFHLGDLSAFVVSAKQGDVGRKPGFEQHKDGEHL